MRFVACGILCVIAITVGALTTKSRNPAPPVVVEQPTPAVGQPQAEEPEEPIIEIAAVEKRAEAPAAAACQCSAGNCGCCKCDDRPLYSWHAGRWHECRRMTADEAKATNAQLKAEEAARDAAKAKAAAKPAVRYTQPQTLYTQPATTMQSYEWVRTGWRGQGYWAPTQGGGRMQTCGPGGCR